MKKINLLFTFLFVSALLFTSCSSDGDTSGNQQLADEQNATEDTKISSAILEQGVLIEGASKETGNPPAPTNNVDFQINTSRQEAFQASGFKINFSSNDIIAGAYIRFKDVDGNPTTSYYDIPASSFSRPASGRNGLLVNQETSLFNTNNRVDEETIDVDFTDVIPAGQFCYDICVYDSDNNISAIETVCVTVEAWGGNADIVGSWKLDNYDEVLERTISFQCQNGNTIDLQYTKVLDYNIIVNFNENGSYNDYVKETLSYLNSQTAYDNCETIYQSPENNEVKRNGNWAYNEDENTISIFIFSIEDLLDPDNNEEFEFGDEFFGGIELIEVTDTKLVLKERASNIAYRFSKQ